MQTTDDRFDVVFASYGALPWIQDLDGWMRGARRILRPGGRLVVVEFHPLVWSWGDDLNLSGDDYFDPGPWEEPVSDYVAAALGKEAGTNDVNATGWQHGLPAIVMATLKAGFTLAQLQEYAHCNFARISSALVEGPDRTWHMPPGKPQVPMMYSLVATAT